MGSGVLGSAIAMDKDITKKILSFHGIKVPRWQAVRSPSEVSWDIFPAVVKPADQGSSVGLFVVNNIKEARDAVAQCLEFSKKVLIEEFIKGKDITVGVLKDTALPPIEIRPKKGIYDYESKYTKGMSEYVFVEDGELVKQLQDIALEVHKALELKDLSRIDFRVSEEGVPYVLEANTLPGMTELSLFPMACKRAGIDFAKMLDILLSY